MDYLKYYWVEQNFFPEIREFFHNKRYLTPEQFFSIIIWKRNASKTLIKSGLVSSNKSLAEAVEDLTRRVYDADTKEKLRILLAQRGFKLAMASAVLTVLYPDDFTVYDIRVRGQLRDPENSGREYPDITYAKNKIRRYFDEYVMQVKKKGREIAQDPKLSLRDCDRVLWARSWHEGLKKFLSSN